MDHLQLYAPAGHHPGGYRAVQSAGEQAHGVSAGAHRKPPARKWQVRGHRRAFRGFPREPSDPGVVDVHLYMGKGVRQIAAYLLGDLNGVQGKALVCPPALYLKGAGGGKFIG